MSDGISVKFRAHVRYAATQHVARIDCSGMTDEEIDALAKRIDAGVCVHGLEYPCGHCDEAVAG